MAEAPDPFARPRGLERDHRWYPVQQAVDVAVSKQRVLDVDDHLDRYILRVGELNKKPRSQEWLRWLLDDDQAARERLMKAQMGPIPEYDESGTPTKWRRL